MDKAPSQLTLESVLRKIALTVVGSVSSWWFLRYGVHPNPDVVSLITDSILPPLITGAALAIDGWYTKRRNDKAAFATKVAQNSPVVLSDLQLAATVQMVKDKKDELPHLTTEEAVAVVNSDKGII